MTNVDPFDPTSPWGERSPWEIAQPDTNTAPEALMTTQPVATSPNPFKIGFTLKAASGYDAEWLTPTVYGSTAQETAERGKELLLAMRSVGLVELTSQAAQFARGQYLGGQKPAQAAAPAGQPSFNPTSGQVQYSQPAQAPQAAQAPFGSGDTCTHGRTHRTGTNTKGPWEAMFCNERNRDAQCKALWKQKNGSYA